MKQLCLILTIFMLFNTSSFALSYQYDQNNVAVLAPDGYNCIKQLRSDKISANANWDPSDLFVDEEDNINVLDSNNCKVHVFNKNLDYISSITFSQNGKVSDSTGLTGMFISGRGNERTYYVADPARERVFIADFKGNIIREINRPDTELLDKGTVFAPSKVLLDKNDNLYVLLPGVYMGACVFSKNNNYSFLTFAASNSVEPNFSVVMDYFWKQILNKEQVARMKRYIPSAFTNFTIDKEGYIYTVTNKSTLGSQFKNEIKKFNTAGSNILPENKYGDLEIGYVNYLLQDTSLVDVAVSDSGNIVALDATMCRIHIFDSIGNRLFSFGDKKNIVGGFDTPVAVDVLGDDIYVLDKYYETISLFHPNSYGQTYLKAASLYDIGKYTEAAPLWEYVLKQNSASLFAHIGLGKAMFQKGEYKSAMDQFKLGNDRENYSNAFTIYRTMQMQVVFPLLFILGIIAFIFLLVMERRIKRKNQYLINPMHKSLVGKIRYTLFHPSEGGMVLARYTSARSTIIFTVITVCLWFVASSIDWQYSGFIFNLNDAQNFEVVIQLLATAGLYVLWVVATWFVSNFVNSSARINDICVVTSVALLPLITSVFLHAILSNMLTMSEGVFLTVLQVVLIIWSIVILLGGLKEVHDLSLWKTILSVIFSILGMALVVFMLFLLFTLLQQVANFVIQIWSELMKMI